MIDIIQWRVSIGSWHCCTSSNHTIKLITTRKLTTVVPTSQDDSVNDSRNVKPSPQEIQNIPSAITLARRIVLLLLLMSGDVEVNPGPKTGKLLYIINY